MIVKIISIGGSFTGNDGTRISPPTNKKWKIRSIVSYGKIRDIFRRISSQLKNTVKYSVHKATKIKKSIHNHFSQ